MKTLSCLLATLALAQPALAADYVVDADSTLGFTATFQGEAFDGSFKHFEATIRYDSKDLATSKFDVSVDLSGVATGDKDRDDTLPTSEFFNIAKFPKAHFVTTGFRKVGDKVVAAGTLSLKGIEKPVELEVSFEPTEHGALLDVATTLQRLDFQVGTGDYADTSTIGDEVRVKGHLVLTAK
ncbi:YceI family protein [Dokdonella immobilis]|uniref:Polyisoprenoid-binding protein YceI n=1 Tax=Dokdonella immobilis TaxID=578942 RepID=A0A1I4WDS3_9GAMM|nr:YceI family protein [Dokdonella immobilis]SFN11547.1 Polyisoprenoid-binding protein YceI [Dokdonella immobilis]